jgi:hypothetical protein
MRRTGLTTASLALILLSGWFSARIWGQGTLSEQVLRLLTRANSWTATNTFQDLRVPAAAVPSVTTDRLYTAPNHALYFNGGLVAGSGGGVTPHTLLSSTHSDTSAAAAVRGSVLVANSSPAWAELTPSVSGSVLQYNGTDTVFSTSGAALTSLTAANLTGALPAISGASLTALNAAALSTGTVPLARLSGLTSAQIDAAAAIPYSKLSLTGGIVNADLSASAGVVYSKLNLANSIVTGDVADGTLLFADFSLNGCTANQVMKVNAGATAWACASDANSGGTLTSVAATVPSFLTISGSPITTSGTLAFSLATESANTIFAGPTTGSAATPTFRALVAADLPLVPLSTGVTGTLGRANGGTGVTAAADDTVLVGNATSTAWSPLTLPNCPTALAYTTSTNLFSCAATAGVAATPYSSLYLGSGSSNELIVTPASFGQATTASVSDPGMATVVAPLVKRGTVTFTSGAISNGACSTPVQVATTGVTTTAVVVGSPNSALQTAWKTGVVPYFYATSGQINLTVCNPTAAPITPETQTFGWVAFVP